MKFFAKDFPQKLNSSILLSEVISKRVKLKSHGKEFMGLCPFHNEKTPSFTVNDQKGFYHCFGCQAHGNAINFVMETEGKEFKDAVVDLADDFSIEIPWQESKEKAYNKNDDQYSIVAKINELFKANLRQSLGRDARSYLINRGLNNEVLQKFEIGFAANSYDQMCNQLIAAGFSVEMLLKTGIISKNSKGGLYCKFRNRVIFPIFDSKGRPIAFGGRVLDDSLPKYLNSAETDIFKKNQTLYNIHNARKAIFNEKFAVVVEGYADTIALASNGIENVVAGLGTALGQNHLKDLFRITNKIVICFDGDTAGIKAAKRVSEIGLDLINVDKNINFAILPKGLDPDDFIGEYGSSAFLKFITEESKSHSQILIDFALQDLDVELGSEISAETKAKIESSLMKKGEAIQDSLTKKHFLQFFKDFLFRISRYDNKYGKKTYFSKKNGNIANVSYVNNVNYDDIFAKNLIALLIKRPNLSSYQDDKFNLREMEFENEDLNQLKDALIEEIDEKSQSEEKNLLLMLDNYHNKSYNRSIKALIKKDFVGFESLTENEINKKTRLLLLKNLLLQVEKLYRQALSKIDDIDTHHSAVSDDKVTEIFSYKHSLEEEIMELESDIIGD